MKKLITPIAITAADSNSRTITGRIVTFEETGNASIKNSSDKFILSINQFIVEYHENYNGEVWNIIKRFLDLGFKVKVKPGDDLNYKMGTVVFTK